MFEDFEFEEKFNPWDVKSIEDFRFYCCPECSTRNVHRSDFIRHAVTFHPNSKIIIEKLEDNKDDVKPNVTKLTKTESIDDSTETITNSTNEATPISNNSGTEPENVPNLTKDDVTVGTEKNSTVTLSYTSDDSSNSSDDEETLIETPVQTNVIQENISPAIANHNLNQSNLPTTSDLTKSTESDTIDSNEVTSIIYSPNASEDEETCIETPKQTYTFISIDKYIYLPSTLKVNENVRHKCEQCEKSFPFNSDLIKSLEHIKHAHGIDIGYSCEKCELSFKNKHHLRTHIKNVHEDVRFNCQKCHKSFSRRDNLKLHVRIVHDNVQQHKCDHSYSIQARTIQAQRFRPV